MKEQVKSMLTSLKEKGLTVQKIEIDLDFSNGSLGKAASGKANLSELRFKKLSEFHAKMLLKNKVIKVVDATKPNLEIKPKEQQSQQPNAVTTKEEIENRILKIEEDLKIPPKYMSGTKRHLLEKELDSLKYQLSQSTN